MRAIFARSRGKITFESSKTRLPLAAPWSVLKFRNYLKGIYLFHSTLPERTWIQDFKSQGFPYQASLLFNRAFHGG